MYYYNIYGLCPQVIMLIQRASCIFISVPHRKLCFKAINQVRIKLTSNIIKMQQQQQGLQAPGEPGGRTRGKQQLQDHLQYLGSADEIMFRLELPASSI